MLAFTTAEVDSVTFELIALTLVVVAEELMIVREGFHGTVVEFVS